MRNAMLRCTGFALVSLVYPLTAAGALVTLYDTGRTVPVTSLLAPLGEQMLPDRSLGAQPSNAAGFDPFPVRSAKLTPGVLQPRAALRLPGALPHPLALVGSDERSYQWLRQSAKALTRLGAAIQVVEAPNLAAYQRLRTLVPDLSVMPASADPLAQSYGPTTYPILIQTDGRVSQ